MNYKFIQYISSGFFSDFNVIIGCLDYIIKNKITNFTFIWNNVYYQEITDNTENLFTKYFFSTPEYETYDQEIQAISIGSTYYKTVNKRKIFLNSFNVLTHFNYFNNPVYLQLKKDCVKKENCLGVHVRGTDHGQHGPLINIDTYFKHVDSKIMSEEYTSIFLATDEELYVEKFQQRYGKERVIINENITRSENKIAIHTRVAGIDKTKLITDVLLDAISLAQCEEIIITSSNVSAYTLAINPTIKYTFIDFLH
jgi:hypothetical protein